MRTKWAPDFQKDEWREAHGREYNPWADRFSGYEATLANYFRPGSGEYFNADKDGVFQPFEMGPEDPLTYEIQCETWDILPRLVMALAEESRDVSEGMKEHLDRLFLNYPADDRDAQMVIRDLAVGHDIWPARYVRSAVRLVQWLAWRSRNSHHVQSIEGDYELFDQYEADWLRCQVEVPVKMSAIDDVFPRRWTRTGLMMVQWNIVEDRETFMSTKASDQPLLTKQDVVNAETFIKLLGITDDDLHPRLADWFC